MEIDENTYRKLTQKEKEQIDGIVSRAEKRKRKKHFNVEFILKYLEGHSFPKGWGSYENKSDVIDMLHSVAKIQMTMGRWTQKQADTYIKYFTKEYADNWFPDDN